MLGYHSTVRITALPALLLLAGCGGGEEICTPEGFEEALAGDAEEIALGECEVRGSFTVDRAVRIIGRGEASILIGGAGAALLVRGGDVRIEDVRIQVTKGVGIASSSGAVMLSRVVIAGSIDVNDPPQLPTGVTPADASSHGLVIVGGRAELADVRVSGMAAAGALFHDAEVSWSGGVVARNLSVGVLVEGGRVDLTDVTVEETKQGGALPPAYGVVAVGDGDLTSSRLSVGTTQGIGLAHIGATGAHADVQVRENNVAGVWAESSEIELSGTIENNRFAGFVAVDTERVDIHDATIDRTEKRLRQVELLGSIEVGDGIQIVRPSGSTSISGVSLSGNERVGLLLELPPEHGTLALSSVEVNVTEEGEAGCVAQGDPPPSWDDDVTRNGTDRVADASKAGMFDVLEVIAPCDLPRESGIGPGGLVDLGL